MNKFNFPQVTTDWSTMGPELWKATAETLYMVALTLVFAGVIGILIGTALYATRPGNLYQNKFVNIVLNLITNIVRPIPFIILLAALTPLTKIAVGTTLGQNAAVFAMTIGACFAVGRIIEQNLVTVDPGMIEAARSVGVGKMKVLWSVVLRESLGPLILGFTFLIIGITDMSAMAGAVGGGGLGNFAIMYGYQNFNTELMLVTIAVIVIFVQIIQFGGNFLARKVMRR